MSYNRIAYSPNASASQRAIIKIGKGDWEISQLSVVMGGKTPSLNGIMLGSGYAAFEILEDDGSTVKQRHYLVNGRCTQYWPLIMGAPQRIAGPGRIVSVMEHLETTEHTLAVSYRRVRD